MGNNKLCIKDKRSFSSNHLKNLSSFPPFNHFRRRKRRGGRRKRGRRRRRRQKLVEEIVEVADTKGWLFLFFLKDIFISFHIHCCLSIFFFFTPTVFFAPLFFFFFFFFLFLFFFFFPLNFCNFRNDSKLWPKYFTNSDDKGLKKN